jgi:hypothetical protein
MLELARRFEGWTFSEPDEEGVVRILYSLR